MSGKLAVNCHTLASLDDRALEGMEEAIRLERRERQRVEDTMHSPLPALDDLGDAVRRAVEWIEPAYLFHGTFGVAFHMGHPHEGTDYSCVAYPDGRIILCHGAPLAKKYATALAKLRDWWRPEGYRIARRHLSECLEEHLWYHGTRIGRRQLRHATTPSGYPWASNRCVPNRIWRKHWGNVSPAGRRVFFTSTRAGAYCPWNPKEWPYGRWNNVLLASEVPPPMPKAKKRTRPARSTHTRRNA